MKTQSFTLPLLDPPTLDDYLEQKLKVQPHIVDAKLNESRSAVEITFHDDLMSEAEVSALLNNREFRAAPLPLLTSHEAASINNHKTSYHAQ